MSQQISLRDCEIPDLFEINNRMMQHRRMKQKMFIYFYQIILSMKSIKILFRYPQMKYQLQKKH